MKSRRGAVACRDCAVLRFPFPLPEPDGLISSIRLSLKVSLRKTCDWLPLGRMLWDFMDVD